jgi:hypothetical protein
MTKFETTAPDALPTREFSVVLEIMVQAVGYREAAEQARATLMSPNCPVEMVVTDMESSEMFSQAWIDLAD